MSTRTDTNASAHPATITIDIDDIHAVRLWAERQAGSHWAGTTTKDVARKILAALPATSRPSDRVMAAIRAGEAA